METASRPETALGQRLRQLRQQRDWTLAQTAEACGVARSTLSKIENAQMSPTYDVLLRLADGFAVDVSELFTPAAHALGAARRSLTRAGEGQPHRARGYAHRLLCTDLAHKHMEPFVSRITVHLDDAPEDWSRHAGEEFIYVLAGHVRVFTEFYAPADLGPGDAYYLDSRMGHRVVSLNADDAEVLWVATHPRTRGELIDPA
ncbi:helix-turn-helix domain-containing protein [Plasticicumulans acidivorans]|uniref:XRE family transcriptional regulator n=1 Tax=Plasticicumulans acidivorans TaxID=886464 RepID=A0A317MRT4_9GAMM|nr:XRE family transcriptional regulator [Plasticicumulans acidivorans]PWV59123.1 XRE family transcriptional regulator [Plasticicumulans acidivorans]